MRQVVFTKILLAPAEGFGFRPRAFFALRAKKSPDYAVLANFRPFLESGSDPLVFKALCRDNPRAKHLPREYDP